MYGITATSRHEPMRGYVPVVVAAEMLGVSRQRVHQLLQAGLLSGIKVGRQIWIIEDTVRARLALLREEGGKQEDAW